MKAIVIDSLLREGERGVIVGKRNTQPDEVFSNKFMQMSKKSRRCVVENMSRRPYYGTKLDKELKDAKDRARAHGYRDD